jgi:hypothetical protein
VQQTFLVGATRLLLDGARVERRALVVVVDCGARGNPPSPKPVAPSPSSSSS